MKKVLMVILLFLSTYSFSQSSLKFDSDLRFELTQPIAFGNNAISKAYKNNLGGGFSWSFLEYRHFRLGFGATFVSFSVADKSKVGNFDRANYNSYSGLVSYDYKFNKNFTFVPYLAIGGLNLNQNGQGRESTQKGVEYKLGVSADLYMSKSLAFYTKLSYVYAKLNITTSPEYEKYFGQAQQLQLALGIKF